MKFTQLELLSSRLLETLVVRAHRRMEIVDKLLKFYPDSDTQLIRQLKNILTLFRTYKLKL